MGVFRCCNIALTALSLLSEPSGLVLLRMMLLALLTPSSALLLDWGYLADDTLCLIPQFSKNVVNSVDVNWGPPSELISSDTPYEAKISLQVEMSLALVAF